MNRLCIAEQIKMLENGSISAVEMTEEYLRRIDELNKAINAYITVDIDGARTSAADVDRKRRRGERVGALAGIAFAAKDNFCTRDLRTSCGSRMLESFVPPYTATVLDRLFDEGSILLGKTNMDEFGMGNATDTSFFGVSHNPHDTLCVCGGSSGGSAAAVATGMAAFALGSDTGGSVRQPAAYCGCVGLKPTYGALSRYGLIAFASSLDTVGVLGANVEDSEYVFRLMRGRDKMDATSLEATDAPTADRACVGVCRELYEYVSGDISRALLEAEKALADAGINTVEIQLPSSDLCVATYYVISAAEASSNLGRYDGIRYGYRYDDAKSIDELFTLSRENAFGEEVKRRILLGTHCLHGEGRENMYGAARAARNYITQSLCDVLCTCDAVLLPTTAATAPKISQNKGTALSRWREDAFCVPANLAGIPAISIPFGKSGRMPIGVQLMSRKFGENILFYLGKILEEASV